MQASECNEHVRSLYRLRPGAASRGATKVGGTATLKSIFDVRSISRRFLIIWASASIVVNPSVVVVIVVCCKIF